MTDRELLERAAKAAGIELRWHKWGDDEWCSLPSGVIWEPHKDDGDAFRLAVKLNIIYDMQRAVHDLIVTEGYQPDKESAMRRAIVRAAAAMAPTGEKP
jgi:hypothetical protein